MASWLMRLKYVTQKCSLYSYVIMRTHMEQHQGQLPPFGKLVRALNRIVQHEKSYLTSLKPSLLRDETMKPTIKGMKDEWVLYRFLLPPTWHTISVGDVVGFQVDPKRVSAASASASLASASASLASASASPASASAASASLASAASPATEGVEPPSSDSEATVKTQAGPSSESTEKANPEGFDSKLSNSERSNSEATLKAKAAPSSFPVIFRRVAAVEGDEMVSSQPSDEPFRIDKDQYWVLADNPAVPAKEALDSRTLGPVHVRDMVGRALYVVRSALDHEPIHNSDQAMLADSAVMAMECNIEDLLKRKNEERR
ncbi:unnamed protein product [Closterium sp. Yama58-4]|nr:unnamed protein product [Closterium sp. Yama58-4]